MKGTFINITIRMAAASGKRRRPAANPLAGHRLIWQRPAPTQPKTQMLLPASN